MSGFINTHHNFFNNSNNREKYGDFSKDFKNKLNKIESERTNIFKKAWLFSLNFQNPKKSPCLTKNDNKIVRYRKDKQETVKKIILPDNCIHIILEYLLPITCDKTRQKQIIKMISLRNSIKSNIQCLDGEEWYQQIKELLCKEKENIL